MCARSSRPHIDTGQLRRTRVHYRHQGAWHCYSANNGAVLTSCVAQDIFRKYPHRYEGIIPTLCASLEELDEPEAKASLVWILGEYADKIDNADELIGSFLDNYAEEPIQVQLQALTAVVKLFLQRPESAQGLVQRVLALATKTADSPDLRDRAYIQWRLLSSDTEAAKVSHCLSPGPSLFESDIAAQAVILAARPPITLPATSVPATLLEELIGELGCLRYARWVTIFW